MFAAFFECRATGLAGQSFASWKSYSGMSSPWGEETGEGGRKNKYGTRPSEILAPAVLRNMPTIIQGMQVQIVRHTTQPILK